MTIERNFQQDSFVRIPRPMEAMTPSRNRDGFRKANSTVILKFSADKDDWSRIMVVSEQARWLPWWEGYVTETKLSGADVITGPFSGCWLMTYTGQNSGAYVGHVGTGVQGSTASREVKAKWHNYATHNAEHLLDGINPARNTILHSNKRNGELDPSLYAIVTTSRQYYVVELFELQNVKPVTYRIGGLEHIIHTSNSTSIGSVFLDDPDRHRCTLTFKYPAWKSSITGEGEKGKLSAELQTLDVKLINYMDKENMDALREVGTAFQIWNKKNPKEYRNPRRHKGVDCVALLEQYLRNHHII